MPSSRAHQVGADGDLPLGGGRSPAMARPRTSSSWLPSSSGLRATARAAYGTASAGSAGRQQGHRGLAQPGLDGAADRCRSTSSHDSNVGLDDRSPVQQLAVEVQQRAGAVRRS